MERRALALLAALTAAACSSHPAAPHDAGPDAYLPPALAKKFPPGFLWGTATAPYQVEGHLHGDDWYEWEQLGHIVNNDMADNGPDSWDDYDMDFAGAQAMGNNAVRIGIDWSRLFPTQAQFAALTPDSTAVARYHAIFASMKSHGLVPMVTLWHFATPLYLENPDPTVMNPPTGWLDPGMPTQFASFCGWAAKEFGGDVDLWLTVNEPFIAVAGGYLSGGFPPGKTLDVPDAMTAAKNLIVGHARCYDAIKAADTVIADPGGTSPALVSYAQHSRVFEPADPTSSLDQQATTVIHEVANLFFLDAVTKGDEDLDFDGTCVAGSGPDVCGDPTLAHRLDFIGLNYYGLSKVAFLNKKLFPIEGLPSQDDLMDGNPETDFHWDIYPQGLRTVLDELQPYGLPIYITENGIADQKDVMRSRFLLDHLYVLQKAINDGYDIRGYFHWALVDNFEWNSGFCPHFGLLHYDPVTKARTPSPAASLYKTIIQQMGVTPDLFVANPRYGAPTFCQDGNSF